MPLSMLVCLVVCIDTWEDHRTAHETFSKFPPAEKPEYLCQRVAQCISLCQFDAQLSHCVLTVLNLLELASECMQFDNTRHSYWREAWTETAILNSNTKCTGTTLHCSQGMHIHHTTMLQPTQEEGTAQLVCGLFAHCAKAGTDW